MKKEVTVAEVMASRMIADPFTLLQCCPTGDGAAAIILASDKVARQYRSDLISVRASHLTSGRFMSGFRDMTSPEITVRGAKETFEEAGLGPEDIDVAEVHDAFSIAELLYYEAFGFCPRGEGVGLLESGATKNRRTHSDQSLWGPACKRPPGRRDRRGASGRDHQAAAR
jgi:benzoylsuccinyl-CoA thiolase BbsB subunit